MNKQANTNGADKNLVVRRIRVGDEDVKVRFRRISKTEYFVRSRNLPTIHITADEGKWIAEATERRHPIGDVKGSAPDVAFQRAVKQFWQ